MTGTAVGSIRSKRSLPQLNKRSNGGCRLVEPQFEEVFNAQFTANTVKEILFSLRPAGESVLHIDPFAAQLILVDATTDFW